MKVIGHDLKWSNSKKGKSILQLYPLSFHNPSKWPWRECSTMDMSKSTFSPIAHNCHKEMHMNLHSL